MPVQILIGDNSEDPRVISLQAYLDGRANFSLHYYYTSTEASFGGQVLDIQWMDLQNAVNDFMTESGTPQSEVALRFVHCFDEIPGNLYLRLQICQMVPQVVQSGEELIYDLITTDANWYEIKGSQFTATTDESLTGPVYMNSMFYKTEPQAAEMQRLADAPDTYVHNLVLPWEQEILQMYLDNAENHEVQGVHFAACSYTEPTPGRSNVEWPHGMVIFLSDSEGKTLLNNRDYLSIFHNKGADLATLCPPTCGVYIAPVI